MLKEAGAEPLEPYPRNMSCKWKCRCVFCGEIVYPRMSSIDRGGKACRYCFGSKPVNVAIAYYKMLNAGVQPLERYPGYDQPWLVRCLTCGHESTPQYRNILKGQGGCFRCGREYGNLPAFVYLVHNKVQHVIKVGITNIHAQRLRNYPGWLLIASIETKTGKEAASIEAEVLRCWRVEHGLEIKMPKSEMPGGGYTETADEAGLDAALRILRKYKINNVS